MCTHTRTEAHARQQVNTHSKVSLSCQGFQSCPASSKVASKRHFAGNFLRTKTILKSWLNQSYVECLSWPTDLPHQNYKCNKNIIIATIKLMLTVSCIKTIFECNLATKRCTFSYFVSLFSLHSCPIAETR